MKISSPASFCPPWTMPNSRRLLDRVDGVAAGIGEPDHLGPRGLGLEQEGGEVLAREGMADLAQDLAARLRDDRLGVALERVAEGVVGGEEEPGVAAALDHGAAGALGQRVGVVGPVDGVGRACLPVRSDEPAPELMKILFFSLVIWLTASATEEVGTSSDDVDAVGVVPLPGDVRADVGLVLVVGRDDLDLDALVRRLEVLDRHAGGDHRAFAREVGIEAGAVVQDADLDRDLGLRRPRRTRPAKAAPSRNVLSFIQCSSDWPFGRFH